MKYKYFALALFPFLLGNEGCNDSSPRTSDNIQRQQQEQILQEGTSALGMPNINNFREKRIMKTNLEKRDQEGLVTYTYVFNPFHGKFVCVNVSIGYPIPYATQYTNPQKIETWNHNVGYAILPQADPNGLFSPASAEGTWVLMKNPNGPDIGSGYIEERISVFPFKLRPAIVELDCEDSQVGEKAKAEKELSIKK